MPDPSAELRLGPVTLASPALLTDLYELTMAAVYLREGMTAPATFSCFVRRLPPSRRFLVAAGLADVVAWIEAFRLDEAALEGLRALRLFDAATLRQLAALRFEGELRAVAEGTVLYADEPLLEVTAPLPVAQLLETAVLNLCHYSTVVATATARCALAAGGRTLIDFGARRAPGPEGALRAARAMAIAGVSATSHVLAARQLGLPAVGTMAHSFVSAFPTEREAFDAFARAHPGMTVLLLDTYDTLAAVPRAVAVARDLEARGHRLAGVRLDSGDLLALSRAVRAALDAAGLPDVRIVASGGLDAEAIAALVAAGAPVDTFALGSRVVMPDDAPALDMAYKLVAYDGRDVLKLSPAKVTWVGRKQVWRGAEGDLLAGDDEPGPPGAAPLLEPVLAHGARTRALPDLPAITAHCLAQLDALPLACRALAPGAARAPAYSAGLRARQARAEAAVRAREGLAPPAG